MAHLHSDERETITYSVIESGKEFHISGTGGTEILLVDGELTLKENRLRKGSWLRLPDGLNFSAVAGDKGAQVWIKIGHPPYAHAPGV